MGTGEPGRQQSKLRFDSFELDPSRQILSRDGIGLKLQKQPFQVLELLVRRAPEVVSREEIRRHIWGEAYVDADQSINFCIRQIRSALDDDSSSPRFVETLPRQGYRFIMPLELPETFVEPIAVFESKSLGTGTAQAELEPASSWLWSRRRYAAVVACAIGLSVALTVWLSSKKTSVIYKAALPFTSYPGSEVHPSFSPDGSQVVFAWNGEKGNNYNLYLQQIGSFKPIRLTTGVADDVSPHFSPDGRSIGFVRVDHDGAHFMLIPSLGGPERAVVPFKNLPVSGDVTQNLFSWFPDGKHIVTGGLQLIALGSGETRPLTSPPDAVSPDQSPSVSPNGRAVCFVRAYGYQVFDIWIVELNDKLEPIASPRQVTNERIEVGDVSLDPAWTSDGRDIIFADGHLQRVAAAGGLKPELLPYEGFSPAVSVTGHELAYLHTGNMRADVHRLFLGSQKQVVSKPAPFAPSTSIDLHQQYSPDGKRVVFEGSRSGDARIWITDADGSNAHPLPSEPDMYQGSPRWSPDGKFLAFDSNVTGKWNVYVISSSGGRPIRLTVDGANHNLPAWSRDGKWIYFGSTASGRSEVWKIPWQGGNSIQVTRNGGCSGSEAWDQTALFFTKDISGNQGLWRMDFLTGAEERIAPAVFGWTFSVGSEGIYYLSPPGAGQNASINYFSVATHRTTQVFELKKSPAGALAISPDGHSLIYGEMDINTDIMLVDHFH
jgi:Tol biopolymer transport system component/DNA-binding winged helix-turn-helix (wHTH) protein